MKVSVQFCNGRTKGVCLKKGTLQELQSAFMKLCGEDGSFPDMNNFTVLFYWFDEDLGMEVEVNSEDKIKNKDKFRAAIHPVQTTSSTLTSGSTVASTSSRSSVNEDLSYLKGLCLTSHTMSSKGSTGTTSAVQHTNFTVTSASSCNDKVNGDSDSDVGEYEQRVFVRREENMQRLKDLNIVKQNLPKLKAKKQRSKKGKKQPSGKENSQRIMPPRAAKTKRALYQEDLSEEANDEIDRLGNLEDDPEVEEDTGLFTDETQPEKVSTRPRRKPAKKVRKFGQKITERIPLPTFKGQLKEKLEKGILDTKLMNAFLKQHVKDVTGDEYPTKQEYSILGDQVVSQMKQIGVVNAKGYKKTIIKSLARSFRAGRNTRLNTAPRRRAAKLKVAEQEASLVLLAGFEAQAPIDDTDDSDEILQRPVQNKETVKLALSSSQQRYNFIKTHGVMPCISTYPYMREADLLIYDYSTRVPVDLKQAEVKFDKLMLPLSSLLRKPNPGTELEKVKLVCNLFSYFSSNEFWPAIQCSMDALAGALLDRIPKQQSPATVVVQDEQDILSCTLVFNARILTTYMKPSAFDCLALLMAGYYAFDIDYPAVYKNFLKSIELILHDEEALASEQDENITIFFTQLNATKEALLLML